MKNENKLTWSKSDGTWGLKNYDIQNVPKELYGAICKLHNYEKTDLSPDEVEAMKKDFSPAEAAVYLRECTKKDTGWIPCSEKLPEEPHEIPVFTEEIEQMLNDGKLKEYIVMIRDAETPTTLCYIGLNVWHDIVTQDCYEVIAWQPLPEPYIPEGGGTP